MTYPYKYYRYVNLPKIPAKILNQINLNFDQYEKKDAGGHGNIYTWSDSFNQAVNEWCQQNICNEMYWGFQIIRGDLKPHTDNVTQIKMTYIVETGGPKVVTEWYETDHNTVVDSVILEAHRWHILKVNTPHGIKNTVPGDVRLSITGRLF
jgi:hypothetical protein